MLTFFLIAINNKTLRNKRYFHFAEDSHGIRSIPELILHPLTKRPSSDIIVKAEDKLENNYELIKKFKASDFNRLTKFMDEHATYNEDTFFYTYKE